ncbi:MULTISPECIES: sugar transferase [unclassified Pseudoalteromonas]|uniref:sugar transferase n=1 Tax=unclassified Pseudoalteromonas TaxID=194690 RepID=UPI002359FB8D|nr:MULTISPECIES: sugar transferase [unclassified Pseudoalteromonas]MDC9565603.1 sugar transferase [Pseudoalteromonas sp. GAB2316C]MDC9569892.1 sugar transferase [Pseudoalteromonas sp. GABNB9D]MDC9574045.1 sugar transferase [Pseudoalteromonas sp. GABNS16A]MDC9578151.1 sugar transferase [Pseudoalteromonas sp. GABNS16E]MDC9584973.1 sugar transferase [Pseudoalteromonas sp. GABNS16C]
MTKLLIRILDFTFSLFGLLFAFPFLIILAIIGYFDTGSPIFIQERVGRNKKPFTLVKFRTMTVDTASVASHLASTASITPFGGFLRKTKLDELPQLWNVLKGEMSLVGPRPGLFNQEELTQAREAKYVFAVRPGITGLAQVNEIDMSTPELLAKTDREMIDTMTIGNYFKYILMTITGSGSGDRVK